jgi:hypothetical protein
MLSSNVMANPQVSQQQQTQQQHSLQDGGGVYYRPCTAVFCLPLQ